METQPLSNRIIIADASKVSPSEFLNAVGPMFGFRPRSAAEKAGASELAVAAIEHRRAMCDAPHDYWERRRFEDELRAAYVARIREITGTVGAPLFKVPA